MEQHFLPNRYIIERLEQRGIEFVFDFEYQGEGEKRRCVFLPQRITHINLNLAPQEWCNLCMLDGEEYIGGCCGQTSAVQDILNGIFREGGEIASWEAWNLIETGAGHDGFETLTETSEEALLAEEQRWDQLGALDKIFLSVAAATPRLRVGGMARITPSHPDETGMRELYDALAPIRFSFGPSDEEEKRGRQHEANQMHFIARAMPAAKAFVSHAESLLAEPWKGWAIVDPSNDNEIWRNGFGLMIYGEKSHAEDILAKVREWDSERPPDKQDPKMSQIQVKPVEIVANGSAIVE